MRKMLNQLINECYAGPFNRRFVRVKKKVPVYWSSIYCVIPKSHVFRVIGDFRQVVARTNSKFLKCFSKTVSSRSTKTCSNNF